MSVISKKYGELHLGGCSEHPGQTVLACQKVRQADGTSLSSTQIWEVLEELSGALLVVRSSFNRVPIDDKFNLKHLERLPDIGEHLVELQAKRIIEENRMVNCQPWCDVCDRFHRPGEKCGGKLTGGLSR